MVWLLGSLTISLRLGIHEGNMGLLRGALALVLALLLSLSTARSASSQSPGSGALLILVRDPSGAPLQDVGVTLTSRGTGTTRLKVTDGYGLCNFSQLPLTTSYHVELSRSGFRGEALGPFTLRSDDQAQLTLPMVATGQTAITVLGTASGLRADDQLGIVVYRQDIA